MQGQPRFTEALDDEHLHSPHLTQSHPPSYEQWTDRSSPLEPAHTNSHSDEIPLSHSASYKERSLSPDMITPGIEPVWSGEGEKEVVFQNDRTPVIEPQPLDPLAERRSRRMCGLKRTTFCIILAAIILIVIGLAVGLGVGLGLKHHHNSSNSSAPSNSTNTTTPNSNTNLTSDYAIGGALNPAYFSTKGAFNGTGVALASESFDANDRGSIVLYFQHHDGELRYMQLNNGDWEGGDSSTIVATDAKNGTPISAVAYSLHQVTNWHIFYIDRNNYIRQRTNSNVTNIWADGNINSLNLTAFDADEVGMQACWYGNDYGDVDYQHTPLPSDGDTSNSSITAHSEVGMHIWYATNETTFQQLGWRAGDVSWTVQDTWINKNGHAGVGCYSWGPGTVTYVMMVNEQNTVEFWWKDTNTSLPDNVPSHPINIWTNSSISIPNVHPSTSLGYTNFFYSQMENDHVMGYNITWSAEKTAIVASDSFTVPISSGLPGTHLSVSALPNTSGGNSLVVFYQTEGDDITQFNRDLDGGQWTTAALPIPQQ